LPAALHAHRRQRRAVGRNEQLALDTSRRRPVSAWPVSSVRNGRLRGSVGIVPRVLVHTARIPTTPSRRKASTGVSPPRRAAPSRRDEMGRRGRRGMRGWSQATGSQIRGEPAGVSKRLLRASKPPISALRLGGQSPSRSPSSESEIASGQEVGNGGQRNGAVRDRLVGSGGGAGRAADPARAEGRVRNVKNDGLPRLQGNLATLPVDALHRCGRDVVAAAARGGGGSLLLHA